eukprot:scaffold2022_cov387-Prasinococcus_capsulatus_cf.AAC.7
MTACTVRCRGTHLQLDVRRLGEAACAELLLRHEGHSRCTQVGRQPLLVLQPREPPNVIHYRRRHVVRRNTAPQVFLQPFQECGVWGVVV